MTDGLRIAGGIVLGLGLALLPFLHARWGLGLGHPERAAPGLEDHHHHGPDR